MTKTLPIRMAAKMAATLSIASVVVAAGTLLGAPGASADPGPSIPFMVSVTGSAQLTSQTTGTFAGSGTASHMGAISNGGGVTAFFDQPSDTCPNGFRSVNTETFTAANGATLSIQSADVTCPVGPQSPGQFRGTGQWRVTGGTGRFSSTTGQGTYSGFADFTGQTFAFRFTGELSR